MHLESDKRLNIQLGLDFSSMPTGEARQARREDIESLSAVNETERPADTSRVMEEVCELTNLETAAEESVMQVVRSYFRPEFLNRIDEIILFHRLRREDMARI